MPTPLQRHAGSACFAVGDVSHSSGQGIQVSHYLVPGQEQVPLVFLLGGVVVSLQEHLQDRLMLHHAVRLTDRVHQGKPPELADEGINAVVKLEQQGVPGCPGPASGGAESPW